MTIRRLITAATGAVLALAVAACGSSSSGGTGAATSSGPAAPGGQRGGPAAAGTVAAVAASSIEVQNTTDGQVTVNFSGTTKFTNRIAGTLADVTVGSCVVVSGTGQPITAKTVEVTIASAGGCGVGGGMRPQNGGASRPNRATGTPGGPGGNRNGSRAAGKVTAVSAAGFTLAEENRQTGAETEVTVTVDGGTSYTKAVTVDASALKVGECVTANGKTDDTGAVTATAIAISQAGANGCAAGGRQRTGGTNG